jgi:hypothetical protein
MLFGFVVPGGFRARSANQETLEVEPRGSNCVHLSKHLLDTQFF